MWPNIKGKRKAAESINLNSSHQKKKMEGGEGDKLREGIKKKKKIEEPPWWSSS